MFMMFSDIYFGNVSPAVHSDTDPTTFPIKIISAKTETKSRDTTYSVEFETETKLEARAIWFSIFKGQKYPVVFGDPTFTNSLSPVRSPKIRYIARLRALEDFETLQKREVEFVVTLDQSTVTLTFDALRNKNSTTTQLFDDFEFEVSVQKMSKTGNTTSIEFKTTVDVSSSATEKDQSLVLSRYVVKENETSNGDNDVTVSHRSKNISGKESLSYILQYNKNNETTLYLDATEIKIAYEPEKDTVVKEIDLRSEYHYWEDNQQRPINGKTLFHEFDIVNVDRRPIKIAHCEAVGDVTIQIGLNGRNGMPNIPPSEISTVQINYGYFREAFALLRYYSGNVADYEAYCKLL